MVMTTCAISWGKINDSSMASDNSLDFYIIQSLASRWLMVKIV